MKNSGSGLIIVAHPDDETIWMGGTIARYKNIRWTIFALCRADDADRAPKFRKVCRHYSARGIMSDLEDEGLMSIRASQAPIAKRILKQFATKKFDYIFTHGANGEYGHPRHRGVHRVVKKLVQNKKLICDQLFFFAYRLNNKKRIINPPPRSIDWTVKINLGALKNKKNIIKKLYGFSPKSFENISCLAKETFKIYH
ncbi:MAG: hypothetical protein C3F02_01555 [Parcubacteria group bacterium]|nr:MAG: hypothetical protein C3F02_01555 [Parcubacteria group bacterium]